MDVGILPSCNEKNATHSTTGLITATDESLNGLRTFLDDWNSGNGPAREREENPVKAPPGATQAHIYSLYLEQAEQEDKVLVERWTETSNILLVFSALQSALVVAFIIFAETSTEDLGQTNILLQSILYHMDNSTTFPVDSQPGRRSPPSDPRVSACWYFSFSCSMLSAFGGLLSKQCVAHYASRPLWANTTALQCRLRELRHDGVVKWHFGWVVDSLILLTQLSGLVFALGLALRLQNTSPTDFIIVTSFLGWGSVVYLFTMISGILLPGCPFMSPITEHQYKLIMFSALALRHTAIWIVVGLGRLASVVCNSGKPYTWIRRGSLWLQANASSIDRLLAAGNIEIDAVKNGTAGAAGVLCWYLVQEDSGNAGDTVDIKTVVGELTSSSAWTVAFLLHNALSFPYWSAKVVENLRTLPSSPSLSMNYHLQVGELLCDLMHRSWPARVFALRGVKSSILNNSGEFCSILREAWCYSRGSDVLPITSMRWPTVSLYLHLHLRSRLSLRAHGDKLDRSGLAQDLPVILQDSRLKEGEDISRAVALAAIVLVDYDDHVGNSPRNRQPTHGRSAARLLRALHVLSKYSPDKVPHELIVLAVRASVDEISNNLDDHQRFVTSGRYWHNGGTARTLLRLLRLGHSWRCQSVTAHVELGEKLTNEVWRVMSRVVDYLITGQAVTPRWSILSSDEGLTTVLQSYGRPTSTLPPNVDALRVVEFVLGLRCCPLRAAKRYLPWTDSEVHPTPPNPILAGILTDHPHMVTQLIHDIENSDSHSEERRLILSVLIKGRDIFFSPSIVSTSGNVQAALGSLGAQMAQSEDPLMPVEKTYLLDFHHWKEILEVLRLLERQILEGGVAVHDRRAGSSAANGVLDG